MTETVTLSLLEVTVYFCITSVLPCILCFRSDANDMCMAGIAGSIAAVDAKGCGSVRQGTSEGNPASNQFAAGIGSGKREPLVGTLRDEG